MDDINYRQLAADIVTQMLPVVYRETPDVGNMVGSRVRHAVSRTMDIAEAAIQELKELKI